MMHLLFAAWAKSCSRSILNALSKKGSVLRVAKKEKSLRILGHPKLLRSLSLDRNSPGKLNAVQKFDSKPHSYDSKPLSFYSKPHLFDSKPHSFDSKPHSFD